MPSGCNVRNSWIQKLCNVNCKTPNVVYLLDCHVCGSQYVGESVQPFNKRMNGHRSDLTKKTLLPVSQHFVSVLWSADVTVKEVNHIRCFAIDIAKDFILLTCRPAMEHLCVLQSETALATLVTTWFTLAERRWSSD
jgi:hypothetical protein